MEEQLKKAVSCLYTQYENKPINSKTMDTSNLFKTTDINMNITSVQVEINFYCSPSTHRVPLYFQLPYPLRNIGSICLVVEDNQESYENLIHNMLIDKKIKVISVAQLEAEYSDPVSLRSLAVAYQEFFVYHKLKRYPKLLTGDILGRRQPVWMPEANTLDESIKKTFHTALVPRRGSRCVSVKIGHFSMNSNEIYENVLSLINQLFQQLPHDINDILSLHLCATIDNHYISLPFFVKDIAANFQNVIQHINTSE